MIDHKSISKQENNNRLIIEKHFPDLVKLFEESYNLLGVAICESQDKLEKEVDCDFHKVFLTMCMKINSDTRTIISAAGMGWYGTAHTLFRDINDATMKIQFIIKSPENAAKIINGIIKEKDLRKGAGNFGLKPTLFIKEWALLSNIKHAEYKATQSMYGRINIKKDDFRFFPEADDNVVEGIYITAIGLIMLIAVLYRDFHVRRYGDIFQEQGFAKIVESTAKKAIALIS
jgi:hypothetical protein